MSPYDNGVRFIQIDMDNLTYFSFILLFTYMDNFSIFGFTNPITTGFVSVDLISIILHVLVPFFKDRVALTLW